MKTFAAPTRKRAGLHRPPAPRMARTAETARTARRAEIRHILHGPRLQARLTVGAPDDAYEREADRVADEILRLPEPPVTAPEKPVRTDAAPVLRRAVIVNAPIPEEIVDDEQFARRTGGVVSRKTSEGPEAGSPGSATLADVAARAITGRGPGRPLSEGSRRFFEPRMGVDLSPVRLHEGPAAMEAASRLGARAFTYGTDVWLGAGEHEGDRRLLGHELVHVIQNRQASGVEAPVRRYTRTNTVYLWDLYDAEGQDASAVTDAQLRTTIEYEDYTRADLVWKFSDTVALAALRRSMDLFVAGVRGRRPNYIRSAREARAAAHGLGTITLTALGFTGDHTVTAVAGGLGTATGATIDDPDGSAPVWTAGGGTHVVAYTLGTTPTMFAQFQVTPAVSTAVPNVQVRALVDNTVIGSASGLTLTGTTIEVTGSGSGQVTGIGGGAAIPGAAVGWNQPLIRFQVSTDGGQIWFNAGSKDIPLVFTAAAPAPPGGVLREDALDFGGLYIALSANPVEGLRGLVKDEVTYNPTIVMPASFATSDAVMSAFTTPHQCDSQAYLLRYLALTFGIPADVVYFWLGTATERFHYRVGSIGWLGPTFKCNRPLEDLAGPQPHFTFHAVTRIAGALHDASYDALGLPGIQEHAPGATSQTGSRSTFLGTARREIGFTCPH